jgi:hypothetical protein
MIIGISGLAGSGKDTCADFLVRDHNFVKVSFADPMKRICMDVYGFSFDQLWGPSAARNAPDTRLPRKHMWQPDYNDGWHTCQCCGAKCKRGESADRDQCYLTPRFALQQLGSEWGRVCREDTWVEYALTIATKLSQEGGYHYSAMGGLSHDWRPGDLNWKTDVVIPDVRFENELLGLDVVGARTIRVIRPDAGLSGAAGAHRSETEQGEIPNDRFDLVIENDGTLKDLECGLTTAVCVWAAQGE